MLLDETPRGHIEKWCPLFVAPMRSQSLTPQLDCGHLSLGSRANSDPWAWLVVHHLQCFLSLFLILSKIDSAMVFYCSGTLLLLRMKILPIME